MLRRAILIISGRKQTEPEIFCRSGISAVVGLDFWPLLRAPSGRSSMDSPEVRSVQWRIGFASFHPNRPTCCEIVLESSQGKDTCAWRVVDPREHSRSQVFKLLTAAQEQGCLCCSPAVQQVSVEATSVEQAQRSNPMLSRQLWRPKLNPRQGRVEGLWNGLEEEAWAKSKIPSHRSSCHFPFTERAIWTANFAC